ELIRRDRRGPRLSVDFTDRLMASLPGHRVALSHKQRRWMCTKRWAEIGVIPAIAASLAFIVMMNGHTAGPIQPADSVAPGPASPEPSGVVLGTSVVNDAFTEVKSSLHELDQARRQVNVFCVKTLQGASQGDAVTDAAEAAPAGFVDELMRPFFILFNPPIT